MVLVGVQVRAMLPLKPKVGARARLKLDGRPCTTVAEAVEAPLTVMEKLPFSTAVPVSETSTGEVGSLLAIETVPVDWPTVVGAKATVMEQLEPGARPAGPQVELRL